METLTDVQKNMAETLIEWALTHKNGDVSELVIEEPAMAKAIGESGWKRANAEDLKMLCSYCDRMGYPLVPLMVVIPGLGKPEKGLLIHAFKATLPTKEANARWLKEMKAIQKTKQSVWKEFKASVTPSDAQ